MDPRCRFVLPEQERLPLSGGEWIEVKRELNAGEQRHVDACRFKQTRVGELPTLDYERVGTTRILAYVTGWSMVGFDGRPEPFDESGLHQLDMDTYLEIERAIDAHEGRISARREARKNARDGAMTSPAISPSPYAAAGVLSGFER
jgi:hypothetical protein